MSPQPGAVSSCGRRGLLIVFEGLDRTGKTTHCKRIVQELNDKAKMMQFPDRTTVIGGLIDQYLRREKNLDDHVVHLLFSSNRWEKVAELREALNAGTHVFVDRYAFSGVAFSAAKESLTIDWCKQPDRGLPKPDLVCFLDVSAEEARKRGGFGKEKYEESGFQARVRENYMKLMEENWKTVNTDKKSVDEVYAELSELVRTEMEKEDNRPLDLLWPM